MATLDVAALQLGSIYSDRIGQALRQNSRLLSILPIKPGKSGNVLWSIDGYGSSAGYATEAMSFASTETADAQIGFSAPWARVYTTRKISTDALDIAAATNNPADNANLIVSAMQGGFKDIVAKIGTGLFVGDGTSGALLGLDAGLDDSNTFAGVNRALAANYPARSQVFDPGSPTAISFALIRSDVMNVVDRCGKMPHVAVVGKGVFAKVLSLFDSNAQYPIQVNGPAGRVEFNAGAEACIVQGVTFVLDPNAPASAIYYLNLDEICLRVLPATYGSVTLGADSEGNRVGLPVRVMDLPSDGLFRRFSMDVQCQLEVSTPSCHAVRLNVTEA